MDEPGKKIKSYRRQTPIQIKIYPTKDDAKIVLSRFMEATVFSLEQFGSPSSLFAVSAAYQDPEGPPGQYGILTLCQTLTGDIEELSLVMSQMIDNYNTRVDEANAAPDLKVIALPDEKPEEAETWPDLVDGGDQ